MRSTLPLLLLAASLAGCASQAGPAADPGPASLAVDSGQVAVDGGSLHFEAVGRGEPVVLLHGGGVDLRMWEPQVGPLATGFRVIRYDARGHGRSTAPMGPFSQEEDLRRVLDHLGVQRANLVGLSMGAGAALDFASAHPERVSRLVLVSISGPPPGVPLPPGTPPPLTQPVGRARLRALPMPRLLLAGEGDSPSVLAVATAVGEEAPEVTVVRIAGASHLVNQDASARFNEVLLRFLRGQ